MNRRERRLADPSGAPACLAQWRDHLLTRRRFLIALAGGSLAAIMPWREASGARPGEATRWRIVEAAQQHLFPSEPGVPGAREIAALAYLRRTLADDRDRAGDRAFILQGAGWLEDMARRGRGVSFLALDEPGREQVLRRVEQSEAGGNWLALLMVYLLEALLADPVYGGNPDGIGWRWLDHVPGFPAPEPGKRYMELRRR